MGDRVRTILAGLLGVICGFAIIQPAAAQTPLFSEETEIQLLIEGPLGPLVASAARNTEPRPAFVTLLGDPAAPRWDIQLSPRGMSRRTQGVCEFPPLRLDFDPAQLRGSLFQGQNKLKLVTRCQPNLSPLVIYEYTAYRLFNAITPYSYRVRPVQTTYRDSTRRRREETQFNYLLEDIDDVAHRNHLVAIDLHPDEITQTALNARAATRFAIFEFMISNLDWDMVSDRAGDECCHNARHLATSATTRTNVIPVPYDFDSSGLVNAPYSQPARGLGLRSVRQRYYRGYCGFNAEVPAVLDEFRAQRAAFATIIAGETRLREALRRSTQAYIDEFFEVIDDPAQVESEITGHCRR